MQFLVGKFVAELRLFGVFGWVVLRCEAALTWLMERGGYFQGIQALRAVAALMVVVAHAGYATKHFAGVDLQPPLIAPWGRLGVILFFAISGFVMALNRGKPLGEFVYHRLCRIYPAYWLAMIVAAAMLAPLGNDIVPTVAATLLIPTSTPINALVIPYWTLVFEVVFYVLVALAIALRLSDRTLTIACLLWIFAINVGPYDATGNAVAYTYPGAWLVLSPAAQVFPMGFLCGMHFDRLRSLGPWPLLVLGIAAIPVGLSFWAPLSTPSFLVLGAGCALIVSAAADLPVRWRPVLLLGTASYGIYLLHLPAMVALGMLNLPLGHAAFLVFLLTGVTVGAAFGLCEHQLYRTLTRPGSLAAVVFRKRRA